MTAQLVYTHFASGRDRAVLEWMLRSVDVLSVVAPDLPVPQPTDPGAIVGWRLISENNRELARSCGFQPDEAAARAQTDLIARAVGRLDPLVVSVPRQRGTGWCLALDGVPVAMSARRYENRSTARAAAALALRLFAQHPGESEARHARALRDRAAAGLAP